ncbi:universal stress protein [Colwellia sp. MEBiC06753]
MINSLRNILTIINTSERCQSTLNKALLLAEKSHAQLTLLTIHNKFLNQISTGYQHTAQSLIDQVDTQGQLAATQGQAVTVKHIFCWREHHAIMQELENVGYDLIIKERDGQHYNYLGLLPCEDWHLLRDTTIPLLLVNGNAWSVNGNVIAAVETEDQTNTHQSLNNQILQHGAELSDFFHCQEHVVNCYLDETANMYFNLDIHTLSERKKHWQHLVPLAESYKVSNPSIHLACGLPDDEVPALADKFNANIVVLGTSEHNGLLHRIAGHTSEYIIDNLKYDVLAIKPSN